MAHGSRAFLIFSVGIYIRCSTHNALRASEPAEGQPAEHKTQASKDSLYRSVVLLPFKNLELIVDLAALCKLGKLCFDLWSVPSEFRCNAIFCTAVADILVA